MGTATQESSQTVNRPKVLCVDNEAEVLEELKPIIEKKGFEFLPALSAQEASEKIRKFGANIAMVISDLQMPNQSGLELRKNTFEKFSGIPFALLSGYISPDVKQKGEEVRVCRYIEKPYSMEDIEELLSREGAQRVNDIREEQELLEGFVEDTQGLIDELEIKLLRLEQEESSSEDLNRIYAILHTIKGTSGFFDPFISQWTHRWETHLNQFKTGENPINSHVVSLYLALDKLKYLIQTLKDPIARDFDIEQMLTNFDRCDSINLTENSHKNIQPSSPNIASKPYVPTVESSIKVPQEILNHFLELSGEVTVIRNTIDKLLRSLEKSLGSNKEIGLLIELLDEMYKINSFMQDKIVDIRKVALKDAFKSIPRLVRDLSQQLNKQIHLKINGDQLRVDSQLVEVLGNCIVHLIRNCADHGIETSNERIASGKPEFGLITIDCFERGENIVVRIQDDGKGIDPEFISKKAIDKGLKTAVEVSSMSASEIFSLIFESGFSTASQVTNISGRGVGMDMVKGSIEKLGGVLTVDSRVKQGTSISIKLPIPKSVSIIDSLLVKVQQNIIAVPQDDVVRLFALNPAQQRERVSCLNGGYVFRYKSSLIPLVVLPQFLYGLDSAQSLIEKEILPIVLVQRSGFFFAIVVDEIDNVEDTVVKRLEFKLDESTVFSAATFLGDGGVGLILDVERLGQRLNLVRCREEKHRGNSVLKDESATSVKQAKSEGGVETRYLLCEIEANFPIAVRSFDVYRIERVPASEIKKSGNQSVWIYQAAVLPLYHLNSLLILKQKKIPVSTHHESSLVLVIEKGKSKIGIVINEIIDMVSVSNLTVDDSSYHPALSGTIFIDHKTYSVLNMDALIKKVFSKAS